jgi:CBS domain-containing protein
MNTPLSALLERKGPALRTVASSLTIAELVAEVNRHRIGCVLVVEGGDPKTKRVADVMSANVMTVSPDATVEQTMVMFAEHLKSYIAGGLSA